MNPGNYNNDDEARKLPPGQQQRTMAQYKFSPEEMRVMRECNKESFWQRCLPLGSALGVAAYLGVQSGYLKRHPRFGPAPKVVVSVIVGYFVGKFSYQSKCAAKLMQLPNSQIGEMLRQRRRGNFQETIDSGFGPGMSLAPFSTPTETYTDVPPSNSLDIDTTRPQYDGLDDNFRPSLDNPIYEEEMPPETKYSTSYDELRKRNRDEYQNVRTGGYNRIQDQRSQQSSAQVLAKDMQPAETPQQTIRTNKYGDTLI
ncbi:OCIA domain-containing protein 1 isoform X2 [Onthophagus taurus]|uniref:OCIA domain-containing protein 1 isoform X2 n=1 Tax=Onthophagus taurus TaxID=166361 RepID=UPI0039BDDE42